MAGELIAYTNASFSAGQTWSMGNRSNWFNWDDVTKYGNGNPGGMWGKSYYSGLFNDAYQMTIYGGTNGGSYAVENTLYVNDNDTTEYGLNLATADQRSYYNAIAARWRNWGGDATVSYTYVAYMAATFRGIGSDSTGKKLKIMSNFGTIAVVDGNNWNLQYAVDTLMTTAHYIVCRGG